MTEQAVLQWVAAYGYLGMFFLLILGIVGLPVPDEWMLVLAGYLAFKQVLDFTPTVAVAALGSVSGLTMSYILGRASGGYVVRRYGRWLSIDDGKILRAENWFQNFGRWVLIFGPFIPGLRNLIGYVAGASKLQLRTFMRFAYLGALISSATFVSFGYFAGTRVNWNYSRLSLAALAFAAVLAFSRAPLRIILWIKKKAASTARIDAIRPAEAASQPQRAPEAPRRLL